MPNLGTPFIPDDPRFAGLRYGTIARFKHFVAFYRPTAEGIEILRVIHGSRDLEGFLASVLDDEMDDEDAPEAE